MNSWITRSIYQALLPMCLLLALGSDGIVAQQDLPLAPLMPTGEPVAPYFEGWYENGDGTFTFSFGYFNFNTEEAVHIPLGPDNFIEPSEFDGMQPTFFPEASGRDRREVGAFGVTVPPDFSEPDQRVVWTLRRNGETLSVPGRVGVESIELDNTPQAMGSEPPRLRLEPDGTEGIGPAGVVAETTRETTVGNRIALTAWVEDVSEREGLGVTTDAEIILTWVRHQGPAPVTFTRPEAESEATDEAEEDEPLEPNQVRLPTGGGEGTIHVSFDQPGDYVLRVRADNFAADDSSSGNQCCWTNGYVRVTVSP